MGKTELYSIQLKSVTPKTNKHWIFPFFFSEVKACCSHLRCILSFCTEWNLSQTGLLPALTSKFNEFQLIL